MSNVDSGPALEVANLDTAAIAEKPLSIVDGARDLLVGNTIDPENLQRLLRSVAEEDCVHSWRNLGAADTLRGLLRWENERRPTELFFYFVRSGSGRVQLAAAGAVADRLTRDFPHPGFCVIGRCYILPPFRGRGYYRSILHHRLEYCKAKFGKELNAIHIGAVNERVKQVITNHGLDGWPAFALFGEEQLNVAGHFRLVGAYMLLMPAYLRRIRASLAGDDAPACVEALRAMLSDVDAYSDRNFGLQIQDSYEKAFRLGWFGGRGSQELEQFLLFLRSIPIVGFGRRPQSQARE